MIAHLRGRVADRGSDRVVLDVHGVGYLVHVPAGTDVPPRGQECELHTTMVVREDAMTLFGFSDGASQQLFDLLLSASGVGPKVALAILSTLRPDVVRTAIATGDVDVLVAVPGIGKKSAQKLILELKDKVGSLDAPDIVLPAGPASAGDADAVADAREALLQLGYGASEVATTLATVDLDGDASTLLRRALQAISS